MFASASGHAQVIPLLLEYGQGLEVKDVHSVYFVSTSVLSTSVVVCRMFFGLQWLFIFWV